MAEVQTSGWCHVCQQQRMMTKPKINHVLHLILTLVTLGLWSLVWITLAIINASKGSRCVQCGTKQGHGAPGPALQQQQHYEPPVPGPVQMPEIPGPEPEPPSGPERPSHNP
jgi:hypothetical protein